MEVTIYVLGDLGTFRAVLQSVAMLFADPILSNNGVLGIGSAAGLGLLITLLWVLAQGVLAPAGGGRGFNPSIVFILLVTYFALAVPKARVQLEDNILTDRVSAHQLAAARGQLFKTVVLNMAVHNADAHLKNFSLLYSSSEDVRLAPAYDLLTVPAYPDFHQDLPVLPLYGKKAWSCGKLLLRYAQQYLNFSPEAARQAVEQVSDALLETTTDIKQYADTFPQFREPGKRMLDLWEKGLQGIRADAKGVTAPGALRKNLGLSDEQHRKKTKNPYENADGGFNHKSR